MFREYDISMDTEEPQQVLSFVPDRKPGKSYLAEDPAEREVASFAFGKGRADWGPLTVYAVMKSGDIYSICPYMPQNTCVYYTMPCECPLTLVDSSIPSYYVHSLECFIAAKLEYLSQGNTSAASKSMTTLYDYQHKYVMALVKQLPAGTVFPAASRSVLMHPPTTIKSHPARQGPFLLQPAPRLLEGSEGGDATDIAYLTFGDDMDEDNDGDGGETEHLGVVIVAYQDGKVDVCLDVEKVEARWESKQVSHPFHVTEFATYHCTQCSFRPVNCPCLPYTKQSTLGLFQPSDHFHLPGVKHRYLICSKGTTLCFWSILSTTTQYMCTMPLESMPYIWNQFSRVSQLRYDQMMIMWKLL